MALKQTLRGGTLNIGREIATLKQMTVAELREKYQEVFGERTRASDGALC